jgi:hypothetical protein
MISIILRNVLGGIWELLLQSKLLPLLVIQTFVEFAEGVPFSICTCIGSSGLASFAQK